MAISLYDASVGSYLQILDSAQGVLNKGLDWCQASGADPETLVEACLCHDMRPLRFQVQQTAFHSAGAIEAMRSGVLSFSAERPEHDYAGLQALLAQAAADLRSLDPAEVDGWTGKEIAFRIPGRDDRMFTAEGFVLSFSLPNFHFHATTAYDILRARGVPLGKLDFMGAVRLKG
ncbi:MAG TPA: DUF1993 domain-containing protein [Caulobacteraceae bacterium]|jgi:hypothetical protein